MPTTNGPTITVSTTKPASALADILIIPIFSDGVLDRSIPEALRRKIGVQIRKVDFKGEWGKAIFFPVLKGSKAPFLAIVGLGDKEKSVSRQSEGMRRAMGLIVKDARRHMIRNVAISMNGITSAASLSAAAVEGILLGEYRFAEYSSALKKEKDANAIKKITLLVKKNELQEVRDGVRSSEHIISGVTLARDLVNQPASHMSPATLVATARKLSDSAKHISLKVLDRSDAAKEKFDGFLAVARGSSEEPYVIHLTYTPTKSSDKKIFIIGKGITFDSGGLSLKPADYMENMKSDMAGAAAVLGLFSIIEQLAPRVEVHGIIATCENMPSGNAYRPGDVITAKNGKTIEVLNTDAEGRITLADALSYASEQQPNALIDLATLTGACMVALGETIAGLWSNDEVLQTELLTAADNAGEGLAALPLPEEYRPLVKSKIADLRNTATSRFGGAITAALFLEEFVGENIPWAHLDIAGPSYLDQSYLSYYQPGATGYAVRTLVEYLKTVKS